MKYLVTEAAIYGVILVAGLVVIVGKTAEGSWEVVMKVGATVVVFWAAHIFSGTVAHLSDPHPDMLPRVRVLLAARDALDHSWGMLLAALVSLSPLLLGALTVLDGQQSIWVTLWSAVLVLGLLGYAKVAPWTSRLWIRLASAAVSATLGLLLIGLKVLVH